LTFFCFFISCHNGVIISWVILFWLIISVCYANDGFFFSLVEVAEKVIISELHLLIVKYVTFDLYLCIDSL